MTNIILPSKEGHWYDGDGNPVYEVPRADGKGMRATTIKDARELGLWPSVTGIQDMVSKPALDAWRIQQYVLAALTLPRLGNEDMDSLARRIVADAQVEGKRAAEFGTTVHAIAEGLLKDDLSAITIGPMETMFMQGIEEWLSNHKVEPLDLELSFCNAELGYGGRLDFRGYVDGFYVVADWKTQATKPDKPFNMYPEWASQLSAYKHGIGAEDAMSLSVVISSTEPGRIQPHIWLDEPWHWDCFCSAKQLYYSPMGKGYSLLHGRDFTP